MARLAWLALAVVVAAPAVAAASSSSPSLPETDEDKQADDRVVAKDRGLVWEGAFGFEAGTFHTAQVYNVAVGLAGEAGIRFDRLAILGQYSLLWLQDPDSGEDSSSGSSPDAVPGVSGGAPMAWSGATPSGFVHRFGLAARYSVGRGLWVSHGSGMRLDFWVEGGVGEQLIRWNDGGYVNRHDGELAFAVQVGGRGEHHHGGFYMGLRFTLAPPPPDAPALVAPPTCAGPCDGPSRPIDVDRSILFTIAAEFGG